MNIPTLTQSRSRARAILENLGPGHAITRSGWPPLPLTPDCRRRKTDALHWHPEGPPDEWERPSGLVGERR